MTSVRRVAVAYFALQGGAVALWWALLIAHPPFRAHFLAPGAPDAVLLALWLPDLALVGAGSWIAAALCARSRHSTGPVLWLTTGAVSYATLYCLALSLLTGGAWLGTVLMVPAMVLTLALAVLLGTPAQALFRPARPAPDGWNLTKTALQILAVWGILLLLVPFLIAAIEGRLGIHPFRFPLQREAAALLFAAAGALNLWTGYTMARHGRGTPLPLDGPRRLVTTGPYAHVRNPMAMAGLTQGAAVALGLGSPLGLAYVLLGTAVWQWLVRPLEEEHLRDQFGEEFERYQREVRCWRPRRTKGAHSWGRKSLPE